MKDELKEGNVYTYNTYTVDDYKKFTLRGVIVYNDGETAVIRKSYEENGIDIEDILEREIEFRNFINLDWLSYDELQSLNPDFCDPEANDSTKYFCIDVETKTLLSFEDLKCNKSMDNDISNVKNINEDLPF